MEKKNKKGMRTDNSISDMSEIRKAQNKHLDDNRPITQKEIDLLNGSYQEQLDDFNSSIIGLKKELEGNNIKTGIRNLIKLYNEKDSTVLEALNEVKELMQPLRGMSLAGAQRAGVEANNWAHMQRMKQDYSLTMPNEVIQAKVENGLIPKEAGTGSGNDLAVLLTILNNEGIDVSAFHRGNMQLFRALLLLNDWRTIAKDLGQKAFSYFGDKVNKKDFGDMVRTVSPQVYSMIQAVAKELPQYVDVGADSGLWIGDSSSVVGQMDKRYVQPGVNQFNNTIPRNYMGSNQFDSVDFQFISCYICPERFQFREPQSYPLKTAIVHSTYHYPVNTNARGDALIYINPDGPTYTSGSTSAAGLPATGVEQCHDKFFIADVTEQVATSSDLTTGKFNSLNTTDLDVLASVFKPGPLVSVKSQIQQFKTAGFVVNYRNQSSELNSQGSMHIGYFPRSGIGCINNGQTTTTADTIGGSSVGTNAIDNGPYKQTGNLKTAYRFNHIPNPDLYPKTQSQKEELSELYVLAISGAQEDETIGQLEVTYVYEYVPSFDSQLMSVRQYPALGAYTNEFLANAIQQFPALMTMTFEDSFKLASRIYQQKPSSAVEVQHLLEEYFARNH